MINKYRVHEVAKDFDCPSKEILDIVTKHFEGQKKSMTALEEAELDVIFEIVTQENSVESFDAYFATANEPKKEEKKEEKAEKAEDSKKKDSKSDSSAKDEKKAPVKTNDQPKKKQKNPNAVPQSRTKGEFRTIDTRASNVDLDKYNEKYENISPVSQDRRSDRTVNKMKLKQKSQQRKPQSSMRSRRENDEKMKRLEAMKAKKPQLHIQVPEEITVGELAALLHMTAAEVIKKLFTLGQMATVNEVIDYDTAEIVATELGAKCEKAVVVTIEDRIIDDSEDDDKDLVARDPVVCVMGHVDHGKTSLLDAIRNTSVTSTEAGGITQHIGAYRVDLNGQKITFLDTPGHAAFTSMRARGAQATDIAVLVVAADDGIMPQTIEAINHAKAAGVTIVVAINKIDKENANVDRVKQMLVEHELVPEEWGGDTVCVEISAKKRINIDSLLEMVLLIADMKELKANPNKPAKGTVIEARIDKGRGPVATVLVQDGTLNVGDIVIAGTAVGHVRAMVNDKGRRVKTAGPSTPVEILGLSEAPSGGDQFRVVKDEKLAKDVAESRKQEQKETKFNSTVKVSLDNLFSQIDEGNMKELNVIIKADVQGSVEAVKQSLEKLSNDEVRVRAIHGGVGAVNESDVMLANASNAIIVGFNVRPDAGAAAAASQHEVDIRLYRVIYQAIEEIEAAMKGMLDPEFKENVIGHAEVRQTFRVSGVGTIAGSYVTDGKITRNAQIRLVRDGIVVHEGEIDSLKRFKDDAKEVAEGFECGIGIANFNDVKEGDIIECYVMEEIAR